MVAETVLIYLLVLDGHWVKINDKQFLDSKKRFLLQVKDTGVCVLKDAFSRYDYTAVISNQTRRSFYRGFPRDTFGVVEEMGLTDSHGEV